MVVEGTDDFSAASPGPALTPSPINAPPSKDRNRVTPSHVPGEGVDAKTAEAKLMDKNIEDERPSEGY